MFYKKGPVRHWIAHRLILKDGAVSAVKDPGHDSELEAVIETASFVGNRHTSACDSLALPTARLQELGCFRTES